MDHLQKETTIPCKPPIMTIEQAWNAHLILLEGIWHFCKDRLDKDPVCIGTHIASMNIDFEYFEDWCTYCRNHLADQSSEQILLSPEHALQMAAGYNLHFCKRFDFKISKLADLLNAMCFAPDLCPMELELWNQAVQRAFKGEQRRNDLKLYGRTFCPFETYVGSFSLQVGSGRNAMYLFLNNIWEFKKEEFEEHGIGLGAFLTFITGENLEDYTWLRTYTKTVDRDFSAENKIFPDQVFAIMYEVLSKYQNKYGFELFGVLRLLRSMREMPTEHEEEWKLWQNAWERACAGEYLGWVDYVYVEREGLSQN